eukprot:TRINITY_DN2781_c0_g1_i1.p1 TRINITY_DN2781_c0_g1~~TRINITY_DN2781_c0_g1_i1.p1  ORF type:complete len:323 (+),score=55.03 TRINITY_DN2781_c0_g1_i1:90-1058(+)
MVLIELHSHCLSGLPEWGCVLGNIFRLLSILFALCTFVPQIVKNYKKASVKGLSFWWIFMHMCSVACLLVNSFHSNNILMEILWIFVFFCVFIVIIEFFVYMDKSISTRYLILLGSFFTAFAIIWTQFFVPSTIYVFVIAGYAIQCVCLIPQLHMNMALTSTEGQSIATIWLLSAERLVYVLSVLLLKTSYWENVYACMSSSEVLWNLMQFLWYSLSTLTSRPRMNAVILGITMNVFLQVFFVFALVAMTVDPLVILFPIALYIVLAGLWRYNRRISKKRAMYGTVGSRDGFYSTTDDRERSSLLPREAVTDVLFVDIGIDD